MIGSSDLNAVAEGEADAAVGENRRMMKDLSVLQDSPFTDQGSIVEVFTDLSVWAVIWKVIERVNANATVA